MSLIPTVLAACLLVFTTCEANLLSHNNIHNEGHPQLVRRAVVLPQINNTQPDCGKCVLGDPDLKGLADALKALGPVLANATKLLGDAFNQIFTNIQNLKQAIYKAIEAIKLNIKPVLVSLSAAAAKIVTCPALKDLFDNLQWYLFIILDILQDDWYPIISKLTLETTVAALGKTLLVALPYIVALLRGLVYNLLQVLGLCNLAGEIVWKLLYPGDGGLVYTTLKLVLGQLTGPGLVSAITGLLGGISGVVNVIPTANPTTGGTGSANIVQNLVPLVCNLLAGLGLPGSTCTSLFSVLSGLLGGLSGGLPGGLPGGILFGIGG